MTTVTQPPRTPWTFLLLTRRQWSVGIAVTAVIAAPVFWFTADISLWFGVVTALAIFTAYHLAYASQFIVTLPHIAILIAALQYVFGAWINFYYPPSNGFYDIGPRLPLYLSYAGPVVLASAVGWLFCMIGLRATKASTLQINPAALAELDLLFYIGLAAFIGKRFVQVESVQFIVLLIANLRFVGVYGRILLHGSGWRWRVALLLGIEAGLAVGTTMFHDLLLCTLWTFAIWIYAYRPKPQLIVIAVGIAVLSLPALQEAKWQLRAGPIEDDPAADYEQTADEQTYRQAIAWVRYLGPGIVHTLTMDLDPEFIADMAVRYNQGWIINRIMFYVPEQEPYAMGATLQEDVVAALVPRVIDPAKFSSGGRTNMLRYAGMDLNERTAMTLGYAGEMYANFGLFGGLIGCLCYSLFFGLIFRFICRRAFLSSPLWWCVVPYIFYTAVKAEDDIGHVLNWTVKGAFMLTTVFLAFPHLRKALRRQTSIGAQPVFIPQEPYAPATEEISSAR